MMPYSTRSYESVLSAEEKAQRAHLAKLVKLYELLRSTPGRGRDAAYAALSLALARYGQTYVHGEWAWAWSRTQESIIRQRIYRVHAEFVDHPRRAKGAKACDR